MESAPHGTAVLVAEHVSDDWANTQLAIAGFLVGYSGSTRAGHATELRLWAQWLLDRFEMPMFSARSFHAEGYGKELEEIRGRKRTTVAHKLSVIAGFYKWCSQEGFLEKNPMSGLRRPKLEYITTRALDAGVPLRDVQHAARHSDPRTTSYYDHGRKSFDSHATYIVSAFVAGS